jgi:hypothetical protein
MQMSAPESLVSRLLALGGVFSVVLKHLALPDLVRFHPSKRASLFVAAELRARDGRGVLSVDVLHGEQVRVLRHLLEMTSKPGTIELAAGEYNLRGVPLVVRDHAMTLKGQSQGVVRFFGGANPVSLPPDLNPGLANNLIVAYKVNLTLENIDIKEGGTIKGGVRGYPNGSVSHVLSLVSCTIEKWVIPHNFRSFLTASSCTLAYVYAEADCLFKQCLFNRTLRLNPPILQEYNVLLDDCSFAGPNAVLRIGDVCDAASFVIRDCNIRQLYLYNTQDGVIVFENQNHVINAALDPESYVRRTPQGTFAKLVNLPAATIVTEMDDDADLTDEDDDVDEDDDDDDDDDEDDDDDVDDENDSFDFDDVYVDLGGGEYALADDGDDYY